MTKKNNDQKELFERIRDLSHRLDDMGAYVQNTGMTVSKEELDDFDNLLFSITNKIRLWKEDVREFYEQQV